MGDVDYSIRDENGNIVLPGCRLELAYTYDGGDLRCEKCDTKMDYDDNRDRICPKCGERMILTPRNVELYDISIVRDENVYR